MAEGEQPLPAEEELLQQQHPPLVGSLVDQQQDVQFPVGQAQIEQQNDQILNEELVEAVQEPEQIGTVAEEPLVEPEVIPFIGSAQPAPEVIPFIGHAQPINNVPLYEQEQQDAQHYYDEPEHQIEQPLAGQYFQPFSDHSNRNYEYVEQQPTADDPARGPNDDEEHIGDRDGLSQPDNALPRDTNERGNTVAANSAHDATEKTIWIDSDSNDDTEEVILKQNFFLSYSDHNYDCADPTDRVTHPQEGTFPVIGGLDEAGNIVNQWMPDTSDLQEEPVPESPTSMQPQQHHAHISQLQHHLMPPHRQGHVGLPTRPVQPYSIGGTQVDYHRVVHPVGRGEPSQQYRMVNDYGNGVLPRATIVNPRLPASAVIRGGREIPGGHQAIYQSPQHPMGLSRVGGALPPQRRIMASSAPGSYQHIQHPAPGGNILRRGNMPQRAPGSLLGPNRQATALRPVQITRPLDMHEREFVEHPHPLQAQPPPAAPPARRIADVAPHRMTQEQRQEQLQMVRGRPAPHFAIAEHQQQPTGVAMQIRGGPGAGRMIVRGQQQQQPTGAGVLVRGRAPGAEELLREPQRPVEPLVDAPQSQTRKFQLKVTDTYSAPIQKASDQLPAQLTEDPPEEPTTSSSSEPNSATIPTTEPVQEQQQVPVNIEEISSPNRHVSPMKPQGIVTKPTPPHRLTQEEKNAHLARVMAEKEKSHIPLLNALPAAIPVQSLLSVDGPSSSGQIPVRAGHPDDTLATIQHVFDNPSKGNNLPNTPREKEIISQIAENLRFSAEKYETKKVPDGARRRNDSGMSAGSGGGHNPFQRYDLSQQGSSSMHQQHPQLQQHQQHPHVQAQVPLLGQNLMDPPHRPRGRPKGSTGPQRNRWSSGQEPVAPHRVGGARTLPPRQQAAPARNGVVEEDNSDSENETVDDWEMRCHCGMKHGDGETVECEQCKKWQHIYCMGEKPGTNLDGYKCELCQPRRLLVTKHDAIRIQRKELARMKKAALEEKKKKRKSEPAETLKKNAQLSSSARRSMPQAFPPPVPRVAQLNDYSKACSTLLATMGQTAGADTLLAEARAQQKAKRLYVEQNVPALVAMEMIPTRSVVLEVNGHVTMHHEIKRQAGGGGYIFMYDGLMKGTSGEDMGDVQELVCVDTRRKGNDSKYTRRSCQPNCVLKHVLGSNATLGIMIVATKEIQYNVEITLPFDLDWGYSDVPLECADHMHNIRDCPFEKQREAYYNSRNKEKQAADEIKRKKMEEERAAAEERRRMEDEVRRERAEKVRKMDEEAEQERLEEERKEKERKAKEREEKKKRDAEKKAASEETNKDKEKQRYSEARSSAEPQKLSRDELKVQQIEKRFRRQEEDLKRKEAQKAKAAERAEREKSGTPGPSSARRSTSIEKSQTRKSESTERRLLSSSSREPTPRGAKKKNSITATAEIKKPRASTVGSNNGAQKRLSTTQTSTPPVKKQRPEPAEKFLVKEMTDEMHANAILISNRPREEFKLPDFIKTAGEKVSKWAKALKEESRSKDDAEIEKKRATRRTMKRKLDDVQREEKAESDRKAAQRLQTVVKKSVTEKEKTVEKAAGRKRKEPEVKQEPMDEDSTAAVASSSSSTSNPVPSAPEAPIPALEQEKEKEEPVVAEPKLKAIKVEEPEEKDEEEEKADESGDKKPEQKKAPKKLSIDQYKLRKAAAAAGEPSTSGTTTRQGFIPNTEGPNTVNVSLSEIPMDGQSSSSAHAAPIDISSIALPPTDSPNTRSRAREAGNSISDDEPPAHSQSLQDRLISVFGIVPPTVPTQRSAETIRPPPPPAPSGSTTRNGPTLVDDSIVTRRTRPSRWHN
ncbi:unnamed protein product [Caenorhabditis sp. 36 PRJEB53466]|nr:unnamed protein product [Caenorhabditis sp. 36 PRJEB53466]